MVVGRVCFHIENAGMGGMGWGGKERDVMGWEWGWGEVRHVEKKLENKASSASLWFPFGWAACGTLWVPVCAPFYHLGVWGVLVPSWAKAPKRYGN